MPTITGAVHLLRSLKARKKKPVKGKKKVKPPAPQLTRKQEKKMADRYRERSKNKC